MSINIYKDRLTTARLFGAPVLYSPEPIPREDVPPSWYCYDLRGTAEDPGRPYSMVAQAEKNHAGSVLSYVPLKNGRSKSRLVKDMFQLDAVSVTLKKFCADEHIRCPETPIRHMLRPASPEEAGLFFALPPEKDEELGAIGHVRIDFGRSGNEFHHSWWPRGPQDLNTQEFRDELDKVVNDLRKSVLKSLGAMNGYCWNCGGKIAGGTCCQNYGYVLETECYTYRLRCNPTPGDYQAYLSCFLRQEQELGLTAKGRQALKDAADPGKDHTYRWYVIDRIDDPKLRKDYAVTLEEAPRVYAGLDKTDRRLGVLKDGIKRMAGLSAPAVPRGQPDQAPGNEGRSLSGEAGQYGNPVPHRRRRHLPHQVGRWPGSWPGAGAGQFFRPAAAPPDIEAVRALNGGPVRTR